MLVCSVGFREENRGCRIPQTYLGFFVHDHSGEPCSAETLNEILTYGDADMAPGGGNCCICNFSFSLKRRTEMKRVRIQRKRKWKGAVNLQFVTLKWKFLK